MRDLFQHPAWRWEQGWLARWSSVILMFVVWAGFIVTMLGDPSLSVIMLAILGVGLAIKSTSECHDGTQEWLMSLPASRQARWNAKILPSLALISVLGVFSATCCEWAWPQRLWSFIGDGGILTTITLLERVPQEKGPIPDVVPVSLLPLLFGHVIFACITTAIFTRNPQRKNNDFWGMAFAYGFVPHVMLYLIIAGISRLYPELTFPLTIADSHWLLIIPQVGLLWWYGHKGYLRQGLMAQGKT